MSGEPDSPSPFDDFAPVPPDTDRLDSRLRRDGALWQARVPETRRLNALARTLAMTLEMPLPEGPPRSDAPSSTAPEISAVRLIPFRRRSRTQTLLSVAAMFAIVALIGTLLVGLAHRGPATTAQVTATPYATSTVRTPASSATPAATTAQSARGAPGTLLWSFHTGNIIESTPAVANGVVYLGGADANLYALDAQTGGRIWAVSVGATVQGPVIVANGLIYLTGVDGAVYAFQTSDGTRVWRQQPQGASFGAPTVAGGVVYVGSANNDATPSKLYALSARTGATLWTFQTNGSIYSAPVVNDGTLFAVAQDRTGAGSYVAYAVSLTDHTELWQDPVQGFALAVANGIVYVAGGSHDLATFDASRGKPIWSKTLDSNTEVGVSPPSVVNGVVYVGAGNGTLFALDASSGNTLWSYLTSGGIFSTPAVASGVVYIGSVDERVYALKSPGKVVWSYQTGGMVETSATVASGIVLIGSNDHNLYAFAA